MCREEKEKEKEYEEDYVQILFVAIIRGRKTMRIVAAVRETANGLGISTRSMRGLEPRRQPPGSVWSY